MTISSRKEQRQPPYNSLGHEMNYADQKQERLFTDRFRQKLISVCSEALMHPTVGLRRVISLPILDDWGVGTLAGDALADLGTENTQGYIDFYYFRDEPGKPLLN